MFWRKRDLPSDYTVCRIRRLLDEMSSKGEDMCVPPSVEAIVCEDGVVIVDMRPEGNYFSLISRVHREYFWLNITPEEMMKFNGATDMLAQRFFKARDEGGKDGR